MYSIENNIDVRLIKEMEISYKNFPDLETVPTPMKAWEFVTNLIGKKTEEYFIALYLDNKNQIHGYCTISKGTISETIVHPREIYKGAILSNSSSVIIAHNHPSGKLKPSRQDITVTKRIKEVGELLDIPLLDHIIVNNSNYFSFIEEGFMDEE